MIKFGTGGWRAIIGDEFTRHNIQLFAKGMAEKIKSEGKATRGIVIGYDRRFLSREALLWVCEVLNAEGIKCYFINRSVPTPLVMYYTMEHGFDYAMMITASHNPALYNGIKVFTKGGRDASAEVTRDIESYIEKVSVNEIRCMEFGVAKEKGLIEEFYPINAYIDNIIKNIDISLIQKSGIKIALDPMYGVSQTALSMILFTARCDLDIINTEHDTLFGGKMPSPSKDALKSLAYHVVDKKYDLGIATDGDADRLGVIDDEGKYLHPNEILVLLYYYLVKYKKWQGDVVRNIATTHMLDKVAQTFGATCHEVPVGFKNISSKMEETGAILGGESSGGLTVKGHINGKDGVYAAALLVEMIACIGKKLSEIVKDIEAECGKLCMLEGDYSFSQEKKQEIQSTLFEKKELPVFKKYDVERVSFLDGCKVYFKNGGWIIARFSGTEPLLRIFCEMETKKECKEVIDLFEEFLDI